MPRSSRGATSSIIACMTLGMPAMTKTLPIWKPGALETGLSIRLGALGNARHAQARLVRLAPDLLEMREQDLDRLRDDDRSSTPKALATASAVMSSWVGPMPPVVKT